MSAVKIISYSSHFSFFLRWRSFKIILSFFLSTFTFTSVLLFLCFSSSFHLLYSTACCSCGTVFSSPISISHFSYKYWLLFGAICRLAVTGRGDNPRIITPSEWWWLESQLDVYPLFSCEWPREDDVGSRKWRKRLIGKEKAVEMVEEKWREKKEKK